MAPASAKPSPLAIPAHVEPSQPRSIPVSPNAASPASARSLSAVHSRVSPATVSDDSRSPRRPLRPTLMTHQYSEPIPLSSSASSGSAIMSHHQAANNPLFTLHRTPLPMSSPLTGSGHSSTPFSPASGLGSSHHFGVYPASLPTNPHNVSRPSFSTSLDSTEDLAMAGLDFDDMGIELDFEGLDGYDTGLGELEGMMNLDELEDTPSEVKPSTSTAQQTAASSKKATVKPNKTPRPPNAWILYRSDKLRAIAAGEPLPNLEELLAETGVGNSGIASSGDEHSSALSKAADSTVASSQVPSPGDIHSGTAGEMPPPPMPAKKKRVRKGMKEPTEGMLALGKGKTGRGLPQADISKMISMLWKRETSEIRGKYERLSELKKIEHQAKYPGYKFQPLRKADKAKLREEKEQEKQAAKREKELAQANNAARPRRSRTRTRVSPSSPYGTSLEKRPVSMGRSISYSGSSMKKMPEGLMAGSSMFFASVPGQPVPPEEDQEDNTFRSYPFPIPPGSLPSMKPEDHPNYPFVEDSITAASSAMASTQSSPGKSGHVYPSSLPGGYASDYTFPPRQQWMGPPPPLPGHVAVPPPPHMLAGPHDLAQGAPTDPLHVYDPQQPPQGAKDDGDMGPAYAVPYIFEPIPIPRDGAGEGATQDDGAPLDPTANDTLAATWCLIESESVSSPAAEGEASKAPPSLASAVAAAVTGRPMPEASMSQGAVPEGVFRWEADAAAAVDQWDAVDAQPHFSATGAPSSIAEQIAMGWVGQQPGIEPSAPPPPPEMMNPAAYYPGVFDPATGYLTLAFDEPDMYRPPGVVARGGRGSGIEDPQGPFLSVQQPLSPLDSWSMSAPTPRDPRELLRPASYNSIADMGMNSTLMNHRVSVGSGGSALSPTDLTIPRVTSSTYNPSGPAPRHVSASAYPPTPLSFDGMTMLPGWDRQTSFSGLPDLGGDFIGMVSPEDLIGDDDGFDTLTVHPPTRSASSASVRGRVVTQAQAQPQGGGIPVPPVPTSQPPIRHQGEEEGKEGATASGQVDQGNPQPVVGPRPRQGPVPGGILQQQQQQHPTTAPIVIAVPPRGAHRGRAVAAKFDPEA